MAARFEERFLYHAEVVEREADVVESIVPLPGVALSLAALRAAGVHRHRRQHPIKRAERADAAVAFW